MVQNEHIVISIEHNLKQNCQRFSIIMLYCACSHFRVLLVI